MPIFVTNFNGHRSYTHIAIMVLYSLIGSSIHKGKLAGLERCLKNSLASSNTTRLLPLYCVCLLIIQGDLFVRCLHLLDYLVVFVLNAAAK